MNDTTKKVAPAARLKGRLILPGDKSLSHRGLLFGALAEGRTELTGLSGGGDVRSTGHCLGQLGVKIETAGDKTVVHGVGLRGFKESVGQPLDCGNSGSTMRMFMGFLSGQSFSSTLVGDESLSRRPMARVAEPLLGMGARIEMTRGSYAPVTVHGMGALKPIDYELKVASAQVKSACLLAALYAKGTTRITGLTGSRDHTERLLPYFGVPVTITQSPPSIVLNGEGHLKGMNLAIPGDPSSAAFWLAAACVVPGASIAIDNLLLNPTRTGFVRVLRRMGATIDETLTSDFPEPVGRCTIAYSPLKGTTVTPEEVPSLIDELPLVAVLGTYAQGVTEVRGAEELRVKESDRIEAMARNLRAMGAEIETFPDGFRVEGPQKLTGTTVDSFHDHRIAMAFAIAALGSRGETSIKNAESVGISYPAFFKTLETLTRG